MDIKEVLLTNYLPYAKGVIVGRAIPAIDGLKPAQRRILYTMYTMGLVNGGKIKSSNIVGQTMKIHPHGDMAIYETMVRMATGNEALNVPYVESKGNFGKVYQKNLAFAAPRYTEAKLTGICKEVFDGINENAVDMIENFDSTMTEPTLLPVKFPSILVNPSNGVAVGLSTSIPSFSLKNTCEATIGILRGKITNASELMDVLGVPEYTTGGYIHADKASLTKLGETGKGSFVFSGTVTTYPDKIIINEIPYRTTAEEIIEAIEEHVKDGQLKEIVDVRDEIDLKGFRLVVVLKNRNVNPKAVLNKLCRLTPLRTSISYNTRVIIGDKCEEIGLYDLLQKWIGFRAASIGRIYEFRRNKATGEEHLLAAWEKIKNNITEVVEIITKQKEADAKNSLIKKFGLDADQADYILDMKVKTFTADNLAKRLADLQERRDLIAECTKVINSDNEKYKIIISDLERIIKNYATDNKTHQADLIVETEEPKEEEVIDDSVVNVILTRSGFVKRLANMHDMTSYVLPEGEEEMARWAVKNNEDILVFTFDGTVYKILVNSIDASRGGLKDEVYKLIGLPNASQIMWIDTAGDYSKHFNLVYKNGRGTRVKYSDAIGKRKKYKALFEASKPGEVWLTTADKFFMITARRKAAYCDLTLMGVSNNRVAFKVARVSPGDKIWRLQPLDDIPCLPLIDLDKYNKEYTVLIGDDELWEGANPKVVKESDEAEVNEEVNNTNE